MPGEGEGSKTYKYIVVLLGIASVLMAAATVYVMGVVSLNYGAGLAIVGLANNGGLVNSTAANIPLISSEIGALHSAMDEIYVLALISFAMLGVSFVLYTGRAARHAAFTRRYTLLHTVLTLIYAGLLYLVLSSISISYTSLYFLSLFAAIAVAIAIDAYLEVSIHINYGTGRVRNRGTLRIEPDAPYSNLLNLRDTVFSKLQGEVRIVDKHFNSGALSNLYRLLETNMRGIKKLEVLASSEMLDAKFSDNYTDFKNELNAAGIELNFMLMSSGNATEQHERFIFDDSRAYKIPPLNIINRKSEHIVPLSISEARRRFNALSKDATKYENYVVKQARGPAP